MTPSLEVANLEQALLECGPERPLRRSTGAAEEVLFVLEGRGTLHLDGTLARALRYGENPHQKAAFYALDSGAAGGPGAGPSLASG